LTRTIPNHPGGVIARRIAFDAFVYHFRLLSLEEGVLFPFFPNRRLRTMARNDNRLVGQGEDAAMQ
jgi:hypothetical protein